ncbi:hypothetical protein [Deinococcus multiflagellatus]|uniref:Uncharacterized protein n=1 Tax=Deinococcus multiflagellatus TaxID=1656887 RepID=A0ABW1ZJ59_9DEIO|nr:hypothetical protein [Deinococcus multiflagellatus]MBZ9713648.1 hypothetical protein [Deinococcus multiflagellatus]
MAKQREVTPEAPVVQARASESSRSPEVPLAAPVVLESPELVKTPELSGADDEGIQIIFGPGPGG